MIIRLSLHHLQAAKSCCKRQFLDKQLGRGRVCQLCVGCRDQKGAFNASCTWQDERRGSLGERVGSRGGGRVCPSGFLAHPCAHRGHQQRAPLMLSPTSDGLKALEGTIEQPYLNKKPASRCGTQGGGERRG